jgi:hypothetical protein
VSDVLLLWAAATADRLQIVQAHAAASGAHVVRCGLSDLSTHMLPPPRPTVAIVDDELAAMKALAAGADEVLYLSQVGDEELARAAARAVARARARLAEAPPWSDASAALGSLLEWVSLELVACVSGAVLEGELLEETVRSLLARPETGAAANDLGPTAADTLEMLETVRESFRRMQEVLEALRAVSGSDGSSQTAVAPICEALARVFKNRLLPVADMLLDLDSTCTASIRPAKLVVALVLLVNDVLDRAARAEKRRGKRIRITLRVLAVEGRTVVEIEDDLETSGDPAPSANSSPIARISGALRGEGVEVHHASTPGRTAVRVAFPRQESPGSGPHLVASRPAHIN